jgi:hypothetical protein
VKYYTDALTAIGLASDVYDVDAEGRKAPHPLGVLSHYDAVIWETGNDNVTRPHSRPGVADPNAHYTQMAVRDFVNEGGKLLYTGVNAGREYGVAEYPGFGNPETDCDGTVNQNFEEPCKPLSNDFLQYYLGSYVRSDGGGLTDDGGAYPLLGLADPFGGWTATLNGTDSAQNNVAVAGVETGTHLVTSSILKPDRFPQFASWEVADWNIPGDKPFDPHTGDYYMYSQDANLRLRGQAGRGLHHLRDRLGDAALAGHAGRRRHGDARRRGPRGDLVRDGPRRLGRGRPAGRLQQLERLDPVAEDLRGRRDRGDRGLAVLRVRLRGDHGRPGAGGHHGPGHGAPAPLTSGIA